MHSKAVPLHREGWTKFAHWLHDENLADVWELAARLASRKRGRPSGRRVRSVFFAFLVTYNSALRSRTGAYIAADIETLAKRSKVDQKWVPACLQANVAAGLIEAGPGGFRPARAFIDPTRGFEAAEALLERLRGGQTAPAGGQTAPFSGAGRAVAAGQTAPPESGRPRGMRGLEVEEAHPVGAKAENRRMKKEDTTVTKPRSGAGPRTTKTTPDPTQGIDPQDSNSVPSAQAATPPCSDSGSAEPMDVTTDPALLQDGGPCTDCGKPLTEEQVALIRKLRTDPDIGVYVAWIHRNAPPFTCP